MSSIGANSSYLFFLRIITAIVYLAMQEGIESTAEGLERSFMGTIGFYVEYRTE